MPSCVRSFCRWTRDQSVEFVANYSFLDRKQIEIEVDRYITWPGQACSYKIGEIKFKELRQKASLALGTISIDGSMHDMAFYL
jgi:uncharacterized protein (DUF885 family)